MDTFVVDLIERGGYLGIFVLMALENIFPPIPSELIMGLAGIEAGQGTMRLDAVILWGTLGTTLGNMFWYWIGRRYGGHLAGFVTRWGRWMTLDWRSIERMTGIFQRRGGAIVFFFRFLPFGRTIVSLPAGMFHMGLVRFIVWTTAGAAIWNSMLACAGFYLGRNFADIDRYTGPFATVTLALILVFYVWRVVTWTPELPVGQDRNRV